MNAGRIRQVLVRAWYAALCATLAHSWALSASAQTGSVVGKVVHAITQEPIENVVVSVAGSTLTGRTLANGSFAILGVPPGFYTVTARRPGFAGRAFSRVEVQIGRERRLTYYLRP